MRFDDGDSMNIPISDLAEREFPKGLKPRGLQFIGMDDLLKNIEPPDWLLGGWLEKNTVAQMVGKPNAGKSLQALDWSLCVATGTVWNGVPVEQCPVIYICGEGQNGMRRRIKAWSIHNGISLNGVPFAMSSKAIHLKDGGIAADVFSEIQNTFTPGLIVIDTLARNFGGNENSTEDMTQFVKNVDECLRAPFEACVLIVHHTGHADRDTGRGSTALIGAIDNSFKITQPSTGTVTLSAVKIRDGEYPQDVTQDIRAIEMDGHDKFGNPFTAPVLGPSNNDQVKQGKLGKHQKNALKMLRELSKEYGVDCGPEELVWVPIPRWKEECKDVGIDRKRWPEAASGLRDRGLIEFNEHHARFIY